MGPKTLVAALAPLLIVALVAAPRPADASRLSSDGSGAQDAAPLSGLRRLAELVHSHDELEHESMRRLLAQTGPKCPAPYSVCGQSCANLKSDADNCGACGKVCGNNQQCTAGKCTAFTASGPTVATTSTKTKTSLTKCYAPSKDNSPRTSCYYDTKCSYNNCGGCGICCPWDAYCWYGQCICPINKCLCKVNGKLKCLGHGEYCPQTNKFCCKAGYISCATGCCPKCSDPNGGVCQTNAGNVCCPTRYPGTRCYGPPGGRQCCPVGYWTGSTTRQCCNKAGGEKPTKCEAGPGDKSPPTVCCPADESCRYNANPNPVTGQIIGYSCGNQGCAAPSAIDPQCTNTTNELTDPPCCCTKCKAPYVPKCPVVNGNLDKTCNEANKCGCTCPASLWTGTQCCPKKKCGTKCCANANDVCYTKNGQQACCPSSRWDSVKKVCCAVALCDTKDGKRCCGTGTTCRNPTPLVTKDSVCCSNSQWTGAPKNQCCAADSRPLKCVPYDKDPNPPPKLCCLKTVDTCEFNENPDPSTGKPIGYACIASSCSAFPEHCTDVTEFTTDPPCCCKKCEDGFVPECTPDANGELDPSCNEEGGAGCGCKCVSKKTCSFNGNVKCCPSSTDKCDANGNCCPNGVVDGKCCDAGTAPVKCPNSVKFECCPEGEECQWSFITNTWERVCCKTGYWDSSTDTCCATKVCNTRTGPKCCEAPTSCKFAGGYGQCCTIAAWTGNKCCSGETPATPILACPDGSRICCPARSDICYKDDSGSNACCPKVRWNDETGCCPEDRWTGTECCPEGQWNCEGTCVGPGTGIDCCTHQHTDCDCVVPEGFVATLAAECDGPPCCVQQLCCDGKCITPDDQNCAGCADEPNGPCPAGQECKGNACVAPTR